jgi:predicted RNA binding protein YcfA (HicA-like mRNA interferase family)
VKKSRNQQWSASPARRVLAALLRIGWRIERERGSHRILERPGMPNYVFAYHDNVELGPVSLKVLGKKTGLQPEDL